MKRIAIVATLALGACTPAQISTATTDVAKVQMALNAGCQTYSATVAAVNAAGVGLIPQAQVIEGFGSGACVAGVATSALLEKALTDPATQAWLENLSVQLKALKH